MKDVLLFYKYIKYFVGESHFRTLNSDLGKFRKQLMNQDIDEDYCKVLQERFSHGTKLGKAIYVKYVKMIQLLHLIIQMFLVIMIMKRKYISMQIWT